MRRRDQDTIDALLEYAKTIKHGKILAEFTIYDGWIAGWEEKETRRIFKLPLK